MKRLASRKGVGLTEAVVAMAIIVVVSVSAISLLTRFANNAMDTYYQSQAVNLVNNALECFRFSSTQNDFDRNMIQWLNVTDWQRTDGVQYTYLSIKGYKVALNVSYGFGPHMARFTATVRRADKLDVVYSVINYFKYVP